MCAYVRMLDRLAQVTSIARASLGRQYRACLWHSHAMQYVTDSRHIAHSMSVQLFAMSRLVSGHFSLFEEYIALTSVTLFCGCRMGSTLALVRVRPWLASLPGIYLIHRANKGLQSCWAQDAFNQAEYIPAAFVKVGQIFIALTQCRDV